MVVYGPYERKDGRMHVIHYNNGVRHTQSYPRYLMEQHLGRLLMSWEEVDHIDEDRTNNDLSNLQILTKKENLEKAASHRPAEEYCFNCPVCGKFAVKEARRVRHNRKQGKQGPFCSRSCAGMAKSANAVALKAMDESLPGSSPGARTTP